MPNASAPCLFIVLGAKPSLYIFDEPLADEVVISDNRYQLVDREIGFYDFLRNRDKAIIGARMTPFDTRPLIDYYATSFGYIFIDPIRVYPEIYFRDFRDAAIDGPAEQAFGDDALWRSDLGTYALQVGTGELTGVELEALKEYVQAGS
jgi:hypothetical protein